MKYKKTSWRYPTNITCIENSEYAFHFVQTHLLQSHQVDFDYVEEILTFTVGGDYWSPSSVGDSIQKYFVAIECFDLTLVEVVRGLRENELCQTDPDIRARYVAKVFTVLRVVAKSLQYLHSIGLVHCNVTLANCAKYDNIWKLAHLLGSQAIGHAIQLSAFPTSTCRNAPPESFVRRVNPGSNRVKGVVAVRDDMIVSTAIDSWAFGKLAFEVLVGQSLFCHDGLSIDEEDDDDENRLPRHSDNSSLLYDEISAWNDYEDVRRRLLSAHVLPSGVDLIVQCLSLRYQDRPSMDVIMKHPVWKDLRRNL